MKTAKKVFLQLFVVVALIAGVAGVGLQQSALAKPASALGSWTLQWADEFNGSGPVSGSNWIYDIGHCYPGCPTPNWGTGEIAAHTNSTANVNQTGGHLAITPIRDGAGNWTSGRIETQRTDFQPPSGGGMAIEASIQLPNVTGAAAQGYWPAFWTLGAPFRGVYTNWPSVGEIDILENINGANTVWGTLHCGVSPGGPCNETTGIGGSRAGGSPSLQSAYHTYRMEFDKSVSPQQIRWYLDGVQYHTVNANQVDATTWNNATNHGFFIILNVAIGGGWPGGPTGSTVSGVPMRVDYVRVYYANGAGGGNPTATRTNTPGGPTPTRTRTPTAGPTPTRTNTPPAGTSCTGNTGSEYTYGVSSTGSNTARICFRPTGFTAGYVIIHYIIPGQPQQNINMTYNSGAGQWEYNISGINPGQVLQYQYTYQKAGLQYDSPWFNWTKP